MKQSQFFVKTLKDAPKDEVSLNAQLLIRAGFVDKLTAGVYTFLPLGFRVLKNIEKIIREEMISAGALELLLPALHPKSNWQETGRWDTYDSLFRFTSHYTKTEYTLGPTHEEIISPLAGRFNLSYRNLPFALFQIQNKFRDEARAKSGLLRGREFFMKDLYSFHRNEADLNDYYEGMKGVYRKIFSRAGLGHITYLTFASGGSFSKHSHEFQALTPSGEDRIHICDKCAVAVNEEIIKDQNTCPECGNGDLREEKAVEVGNIFKLRTKFSEPFALTYKDENGKNEAVEMGCYGIGLNRLMGTVVEAHHDDRGIVWPEAVAPFKYHLIAIGESAAVKSESDRFYEDLKKRGAGVFYDDRDGVSAGEKFSEADLIGIPVRLVVSEKTIKKGGVELKKRGDNQARTVKIEELFSAL